MVGQLVGPVIGKVAQRAAKKGIEKLFQQLLKNKIQKEGILKPFHNLLNKKASTAYGTRPDKKRLQPVYDAFGKNVLERVNLRENAAASESNIQFLNQATALSKIKKTKTGGKEGAIKYSEDDAVAWVKLNEGKQGAVNRDFIVKQLKDHKTILGLDRRAKQLFPDFKIDPYHKTIYSADEAKDNSFMLGLENLSNYAWKYQTTGRELRGQDLKDVMWPKNPEIHNLWKGDEFAHMVNQGIRKQHNNLFPDHFNQYSSMTSAKKSLQEQAIPLQNKEFMKILNYTGGIPKSRVINFVDDINIMGPKNTQTVSDVYGTAYNAAKIMKDAHPGLTSSLRQNIRMLINRTFMAGFKSGNKDVRINSMMKFVEKMKDPKWANAYVDLVNKRMYYEDFFKLAEKMTGVKGAPDINLTGFDKTLSISHKKALKNYYELGIDINNLFLQGSTKNLKQGTKTISAGKVRDELKLLTDRMEDHYYQVMGLNRGGLINDPLTAMMHSGGFMDYGEMKPVVPLLEPGERQHLQLGGKAAEAAAKAAAKAGVKYVKRQILPKVIGHVEKIVPKLTASKEATKKAAEEAVKKSTELKKPWAAFDKEGAQIKEFKTKVEGDAWVADIHKKKVAGEYEGDWIYKIDKIPWSVPKEAPITKGMPAIVWKIPTVVKNAPMEIGQGKQWLGFLKKSVSPKELEDTSIGPYLEFHVPNEKISKEQLLKAFDEVSPKFDVIPLGKRDTKQMVSKISEKFNNVRERMEGFSTQDKKALSVFSGAFTKLGQAEKMAGPLKEKDATYNLIGNEINRVMKQLYDIDNAVMNVGALRDPRIPGPIRSIFGDLQELLKIRGAKHAFQKAPEHAGQQVLPGGINYREYVFTTKPGSLRLNEPVYKPSSHTFDLSDDMVSGMFVHTRISDRTDNFGRKLLFIEEIQSDMHQKIQAALREGSGGGYATRQDKIAGIQPIVREMEKIQMQIDQVLAKNPKDAKLPELYSKREALAEEIYVKKAKIGEVSQSGTPEGPFQRSEDYGSFVAKYLLRLAKEGNYDGVAVSTGAIKNRLKSEARGNLTDEEATGHYGFYDAIMQNALKKIAKKGNLDYTYTVINDGQVNWGNVPVLLLKAADKVLEGLPAFKEGGMVRENFVDVVPLL